MLKKLSILIIVCLLFSLVGCASNKAENNTVNNNEQADVDSPETETSEKLRVALILPGTYNDSGWNASAYEGLQAIESKFGAEINVAEMVPQSDIEERLR